MSEPEREESEVAPQSDPTPSPAKHEFKKNRLRRSVVALIAGGLAIGLLQWLAPKQWMPAKFDHQIANMLSISIGITVAIYVAFQ